MDAELKQRWIDALKSGKYPKTKGALCRPIPGEENKEPVAAGFCCLGVLADISGLGQWEDGADKRYRSFRETLTKKEEVGYLPTGMSSRLGFNYRQMQEIAELNDQSDTFDPVIALIEAKL